MSSKTRIALIYVRKIKFEHTQIGVLEILMLRTACIYMYIIWHARSDFETLRTNAADSSIFEAWNKNIFSVA